MNKGKPSGFKADTKKDPGAKSTQHSRYGTTGAGPEWTERKQQPETVPAGRNRPNQQAGGPHHRGGDAHEDRNP
jgi:hypothetical protein